MVTFFKVERGQQKWMSFLCYYNIIVIVSVNGFVCICVCELNIILYTPNRLRFLKWWRIRLLPLLVNEHLHTHTKKKNQILHIHLVTTPSRWMMFGWSNWPMMLASDRKSLLCLSVYPAFSVLMATQISLFPGILRRPLQTSPNSPENTRSGWKCGMMIHKRSDTTVWVL